MNNYHAQGSDIQFIHSLVMTFPKPKCILQLLTVVSITHAFQQGGRSCAGARKVWTQTKILNPNIRYFVTN